MRFHMHADATPWRMACSVTVLAIDSHLRSIHFPISLKFVPFETRYPPEWIFDPGAAKPTMELEPVPLSETWRAMEGLIPKGLAKHIGVCNFNTAGLRDLLSYATIAPEVLQVELHPYLQQPKLLRYAAENGLAVTGFSPLGAGSYIELGGATAGDSALQHPTVVGLASEIRVSPAQVVLRWALQRGPCRLYPSHPNPIASSRISIWNGVLGI